MMRWAKVAGAGLGVVLVAGISVTVARGQPAPAPSAPPGAQKSPPTKSTAPPSLTDPAAAGRATASAPPVQRLRGTVKEISGGTLFVIGRSGKPVPLLIQPTTILSGIGSDGEKVEPRVLTAKDLKAGDPITVQYVEMEGKKLAAQVKLQGKSDSSKPAR